MNMVAIPKQEYTEILKRQARLEVAFARLAHQIEEPEGELRPEYVARIKRQSKLIDEGKGRQFKNIKELKAYIRNL